MKKPSLTIIAEPGPLRDGLFTIARTYDTISSIDVLPLDVTRTDFDRQCLDIVLIDCPAKLFLFELIKITKSINPLSTLIVVVDNISWKTDAQLCSEAQAVLTRGFTSQDLFAAIQAVSLDKPKSGHSYVARTLSQLESIDEEH